MFANNCGRRNGCHIHYHDGADLRARVQRKHQDGTPNSAYEVNLTKMTCVLNCIGNNGSHCREYLVAVDDSQLRIECMYPVKYAR